MKNKYIKVLKVVIEKLKSLSRKEAMRIIFSICDCLLANVKSEEEKIILDKIIKLSFDYDYEVWEQENA